MSEDKLENFLLDIHEVYYLHPIIYPFLKNENGKLSPPAASHSQNEKGAMDE